MAATKQDLLDCWGVVQKEAERCSYLMTDSVDASMEDLLQAGFLIALERVLPKYDKERGIKFAVYLGICLRNYYGTRVRLCNSRAWYRNYFAEPEERGVAAVAAELGGCFTDGMHAVIDVMMDPPEWLLKELLAASRCGRPGVRVVRNLLAKVGVNVEKAKAEAELVASK